MRKVSTSAFTKILRALGMYGPLTAKQLIKITQLKGVQARIAEFNRVFTNIEIGSTGSRPTSYYLHFPDNIKLDTNFVYPNKDSGSYKLNEIKFTKMSKKGRK